MLFSDAVKISEQMRYFADHDLTFPMTALKEQVPHLFAYFDGFPKKAKDCFTTRYFAFHLVLLCHNQQVFCVRRWMDVNQKGMVNQMQDAPTSAVEAADSIPLKMSLRLAPICLKICYK